MKICRIAINLLLGSPREELYKEEYVLECLLRFTEVPKFESISLLSTASFCVILYKMHCFRS